MDELLIEFVRGKPELYDMSSTRYSDNIYKNKAWEEIGRKLNRKGYECKQRWVSLRSQYRKTLRKCKTRSTQGRSYMAKWKFEDQMSFLKPFMKDKPRVTPFQFCDSFGKEEESCGDDTEGNGECTDSGEVSTCNSQQDTLNTINNFNTDYWSLISKKEEISQTANEVTSQSLIKYILEQKNKEEKSNQDPVDIFFAGIAATVKSFNPTDQHIIKRQIFQLVSDMEGKYVNP